MNMQSWCISEDERAALCTWSTGPAAAEAWDSEHCILPGIVC